MVVRYDKIRHISTGRFGSTTLVRCATGGAGLGRLAVLKSFGLSHFGADGAKGAVAEEVAALARLRHPNLLQVLEVFQEGGVLCVVAEYAEGGHVLGCIERARFERRPLEERLVLQWVVQAMLALKFVHENGLLHRDLRARRLLLLGGPSGGAGGAGAGSVCGGRLVLSGLAAAAPLTHMLAPERPDLEALRYLCPELVAGGAAHARSSDMWSFGVILFELLALRSPFEDDHPRSLAERILINRLPPLPPAPEPAPAPMAALPRSGGGGRSPLAAGAAASLSLFGGASTGVGGGSDGGAGVAAGLRRLCLALLSRDPAARPSAAAVVQEAFVQDYLRRLLNAEPPASARGAARPVCAQSTPRAAPQAPLRPQLPSSPLAAGPPRALRKVGETCGGLGLGRELATPRAALLPWNKTATLLAGGGGGALVDALLAKELQALPPPPPPPPADAEAPPRRGDGDGGDSEAFCEEQRGSVAFEVAEFVIEQVLGEDLGLPPSLATTQHGVPWFAECVQEALPASAGGGLEAEERSEAPLELRGPPLLLRGCTGEEAEEVEQDLQNLPWEQGRSSIALSVPPAAAN